MKSNITSNFGPLLRACYVFLTAIAVIWATPRNAQAQLYVADAISNSIYAFNVETGQGIPAIGIPFIAGLAAKGLAVSRNKLRGLRFWATPSSSRTPATARLANTTPPRGKRLTLTSFR